LPERHIHYQLRAPPGEEEKGIIDALKGLHNRLVLSGGVTANKLLCTSSVIKRIDDEKNILDRTNNAKLPVFAGAVIQDHAPGV
jgi:hypothetical protein